MPKNITLIVNHLLDGGAARVAVHLSQAWADMGRKVTILTTDDGQVPPNYALHPQVIHRCLDLREDSSHILAALGHNVRRLAKLRRAIRETRPDLLISFLDRNNVMCLLAARTLRRIPTIVSERTDPHGRPIGRAWEALRRLTYPWADCLVTQSRHAMAYFPGTVQAKGRVIPNPVYLLPANSPQTGPRSRSLVLTLGRLSKVKGHDQLIDAFALIAKAFPDWDLCIHGDGPERAALLDRIRAHGLEGRINLGPNLTDVGSRLREADLFVLPSRVEGFPNALAEAMACGLPVVSFDCHSGPSELIREGVDGMLVPAGDIPALSKAMAGLMESPSERARLGAKAPEVLTRFSPISVLEDWESAIQSAIRAAHERSS